MALLFKKSFINLSNFYSEILNFKVKLTSLSSLSDSGANLTDSLVACLYDTSF